MIFQEKSQKRLKKEIKKKIKKDYKQIKKSNLKSQQKKKKESKTNQEGKTVLKYMIDKKEKKLIECPQFNHKEVYENKENLTSSEFNEEKQGININDISSFQLEEKSDFLFLNENKDLWLEYLDINEKQFCQLFERIIEISSQKKNNVNLLNELISKIGIFFDFQEKLDKTDFVISDKVVSDIWFLAQFNEYYTDVFKRKNNISIYKIRYSDIIRKTIDIKWNNILCFIGFNKELRYENKWDYWWFLWFLPKRLIIIWIAKIDMIKAEDKWWVKLIFEWKQYFFEVLRSKGIKNWLITFIEDDKNKE